MSIYPKPAGSPSPQLFPSPQLYPGLTPSSFTLYRLALDSPLQYDEQVGDPLTNQGGAPVPAIRTALRHAVAIATFPPQGQALTQAAGLALRRQLRSLLNNTPMKQSGWYLAWTDDPEQNGWLLPDQGQFASLDGQSGLATGAFKIEQFVWFKAGAQRTHRRAVGIYLKDLRTANYPRDVLRRVVSTDFSGLTALALSYFPPFATDLTRAVNGQRTVAQTQPTGEDGGATMVVGGLLDLERVSYEQPEAVRNTGQVLVFDRRNNITNPQTGPDAGWEEFYGPDYPLYWMVAGGGTPDTPVLDNGRVRVRYDQTNTPGWRIEWWTAGAWVEQGKVTVQRIGSSTNLCDTLNSTELVEYTETRAIVQAVMSASADRYSRELVYITLEQGTAGPRFEVYPAAKQDGTAADAAVVYTLATVDGDDSAVKFDGVSGGLSPTGSAVNNSTALGAGHTGLWATATLGAANFTNSENEIAVLRSTAARVAQGVGVQFAVVQAPGAYCQVSSDTHAYGAPTALNNVQTVSQNGQGYVSAQISFVAQQAQQTMEAESMTLGAGTTSAADTAASNGHAASATRSTDANPHTTQTAWPNAAVGKYRIFARARLGTGATAANVYAKTGATTGATVALTSATYTWLDLGDLLANNTTLELHAWINMATPAGSVLIDRVEAVLMEDRTAATNIWAGCRDTGQAQLWDSRCIPTLVTRTV